MKILDFLNFGYFWDSKNLGQANHKHMHMFCLLGSFEISELRNQENLTSSHFLIFFVLGRYLRLRDITPKKQLVRKIWKYVIFSFFTISDFPRISGKQIIGICICFACLAASRCQNSSKSRNCNIFLISHVFCAWPIFAFKWNYA